MADSPYITWYTSDFLNGVASADMTAEQIGVYAVVLNLIGDQGGPIDDDSAWIARRCNISTRRAGMILAELEAMPNKIVRRNGLIGNRRMLAEVQKRDKRSRQAKAAADARWERWREGHKPQLPLEQNGAKKHKKARDPAIPDHADAQPDTKAANGQLSPDYPGDNPKINPEIKTGINSQDPQNSADADANEHGGLARAAVIPESESIQSNDHKTLTVEGDDRSIDRPNDLISLLELVCAAAGYVPTTVTAQAKALDYIKAWRDGGIDFPETVLPTIRRLVHESADPTSSLARFDKQIRHDHARRTGRPKDAPPLKPPPEPILEFEGEAEIMRTVRAKILEHLGPRLYALHCHTVKLSSTEGPNDTIPLIVTHQRASPFRLLDAERTPLIHHIAKQNGFTVVWER